MSTNYYIDTPPSCGGKCATHCKGETIHLGKYSGGWAFTFRAYPEPSPVHGPEAVTWPVNDYASWLRMLDLGEIYDEYHAPISREEMLDTIKSVRGKLNTTYGGDFLDADGNRFIPGEFC